MIQSLRYVMVVLAFTGLALAASYSHGADFSGIAFTRVSEPKEGAFTILIPKGWQVSGGIYRINAANAGGPLNAIEAKCDLMIQKDAGATVAFRILPDIVYCHVGIGGGYWAPGSYYQGAMVRQIEDAPTHTGSIFSAVHGAGVSPKILKLTRLAGEIQSLEHGLSYMNRLFAQIGLGNMQFRCDAAGGVFEYTENGTRFREVILTGIVDMRAALTWKNTRSLMFRAPADQFDKWRPVMDIVRFSIRFDPQWILREAQGQRERADMVMKIHEEIRRIDREIAAKSSINRQEIMNDNYLVLTGQEEFVNPHTKQVETDTDAFKFRWTTPGGDIYYTNNGHENPNTFLHQTGFERTPVRKRKNE